MEPYPVMCGDIGDDGFGDGIRVRCRTAARDLLNRDHPFLPIDLEREDGAETGEPGMGAEDGWPSVEAGRKLHRASLSVTSKPCVDGPLLASAASFLPRLTYGLASCGALVTGALGIG